jgi:conjugal transfer pilus assembly protein TraK
MSFGRVLLLGWVLLGQPAFANGGDAVDEPVSADTVALPGVPPRIANATRPPPPASRIPPPLAPSRAALLETRPLAIEIEPGVNQVLEIARGHLNRILTPFERPRIRTTSDAQTSVQGRAVYVATDAEQPVTLFISPKGDDSVAVSLTLVPRVIPPREVHLKLTGYTPVGGADEARRWEQSQPYIASLTELARQLALGKAPPGYALRPPKTSDPAVRCHLPMLRIEPGQALDGHHWRVMVARATNRGSRPLTVDATRCYRDGVLAVAAWPRARLGPGQATELYVVFRRVSKKGFFDTIFLTGIWTCF